MTEGAAFMGLVGLGFGFVCGLLIGALAHAIFGAVKNSR
jgi:hypothetical protein